MSKLFKIVVCGGRHYADVAKVYGVMDIELAEHGEDLLVIHGDCPSGGADALVDRWAKSREVDCLRVPPKVLTYKWPAAGPVRNKRMRDRYRPDKVIGFPGGAGTAGMLALAREAGIAVVEVE